MDVAKIKASGDAALAQISNALDDLEYSPDQRPVPLLRLAMDYVRDIIAELGQEVGAVADGLEFFAVTDDLHPETVNLVSRFAAALAEKLAISQRKYGYSNGWASPGWMDECREKLAEHIAKGDPRDVAAYCAFLWHHGESTSPAHTSEARDAARLDWLERFTSSSALLLHNGEGSGSGFTGLGLKNTGRTLRQAIDAAMRQEGE